jgi:hypothetical protein
MAARIWPSVRDRFMSKVQKLENGCWDWNGTYANKGSGDSRCRPHFWKDGRPQIAARVSWELFRGPIPEGKMLCHKRECSNERCVNPDHLYPGDQASNMADRDAVDRTSRWSHRYNFVQTPEMEAKVREMRQVGTSIEEICRALDIGRSTYYRMFNRGIVDKEANREASRANYRKAALER